MRKRNKLLASLFALAITLPFIMLFAPQARAATAVQLRDQINGIAGLTAIVAGGVVTVVGNVSAISQITLHMNPGVAVNWEANYSGSLSARYSGSAG